MMGGHAQLIWNERWGPLIYSLPFLFLALAKRQEEGRKREARKEWWLHAKEWVPLHLSFSLQHSARRQKGKKEGKARKERKEGKQQGTAHAHRQSPNGAGKRNGYRIRRIKHGYGAGG